MYAVRLLRPTTNDGHDFEIAPDASRHFSQKGDQPLKRRFSSSASFATTLLVLTGCISTSPAAQKVRITNNPEVVRGCKFLGNVRATSGWGGPAGSGIAAHNTEAALREKTARLKGNVVYVVASGVKATGEAYKCPEP